ncbi:MAG TPA: ATP-binding protein [Thermodesulfobacteriota bacterium]
MRVQESGADGVAALATALPAALARAAGAHGGVLLVADEPGGDLVPRGVAAADRRRLPPTPRSGGDFPALAAAHPLARWLAERGVALARGGAGEPPEGRTWLADLGLDAAVGLVEPDAGRLSGAVLLSGGARPLGRRRLAALLETSALRLEAARLRDRLRTAQAALERAERLVALGTLTASLAHELKNPLVAIRTFAQLLPERYDDPDFRSRFAPIALAEIDRATSLLTELLDFARAPRDAAAPARSVEPADVNAILGQMLVLAEAEARGRRIRIARRLDPGLPHVAADRDRMKQLFLNLLLNAIEAIDGDEGEVTVETATRLEEEGAFVAIDVSDTGSGIAPADLPSLFTPFFTRKVSGVGLGLSVCRDIVHAHRGRIEIHSEPGRGTTVRVRLPVAGAAS